MNSDGLGYWAVPTSFVAGEGKLLPRVLPLAAGQEESGMGGRRSRNWRRKKDERG